MITGSEHFARNPFFNNNIRWQTLTFAVINTLLFSVFHFTECVNGKYQREWTGFVVFSIGAMALERCYVETWAEFGFIGMTCSPKLVFGSQTDVFLCAGCDEIYVYSTKERTITASKSYTNRQVNHTNNQT